jgi:hypothetical protein
MQWPARFIAEASIPAKGRPLVVRLITRAKGRIAAKAKAGYPCLRMNVTPKAAKSRANFNIDMI